MVGRTQGNARHELVGIDPPFAVPARIVIVECHSFEFEFKRVQCKQGDKITRVSRQYCWDE